MPTNHRKLSVCAHKSRIMKNCLLSQAELGGWCAGRTSDILQEDSRQVRLSQCPRSREPPFAKGMKTCTAYWPTPLSSPSLGRLATHCYPQFKEILKKKKKKKSWSKADSTPSDNALKGENILHKRQGLGKKDNCDQHLSNTWGKKAVFPPSLPPRKFQSGVRQIMRKAIKASWWFIKIKKMHYALRVVN